MGENATTNKATYAIRSRSLTDAENLFEFGQSEILKHSTASASIFWLILNNVNFCNINLLFCSKIKFMSFVSDRILRTS